MNRREFLASTSAALAAALARSGFAQSAGSLHGFPASELKNDPYIESTPIAGYHCAPASAYEAFQDMKFGIRIHWGIYSIWHRGAESWPFLEMSFEDRQKYNHLYQTWNPAGFDADSWMDTFRDSRHEDVRLHLRSIMKVSPCSTPAPGCRNRANWTRRGGPKIEACDLAYSIMETPFRRDVVKELCDAAHKRDIKIDLYFSHPDWYDADFRPYVAHPLQVPPLAQPDDAARPGTHAAHVREHIP